MNGHDIVATYKRLAHAHGKRPVAVVVADWVDKALRMYYREHGLPNANEFPLTIDGVPVMVDPNLKPDASDRITVVSAIPQTLVCLQMNPGYFDELESE